MVAVKTTTTTTATAVTSVMNFHDLRPLWRLAGRAASCPPRAVSERDGFRNSYVVSPPASGWAEFSDGYRMAAHRRSSLGSGVDGSIQRTLRVAIHTVKGGSEHYVMIAA